VQIIKMNTWAEGHQSHNASHVDTRYTTEPKRQDVGTFADVLPKTWKMSNDYNTSLIKVPFSYVFTICLLL
jgi:hypothetical protein